MIQLTKLDGSTIFINEENIQWVEILPDTAITFIGGARVIVREKVEEVLAKIEHPESTKSLSALAHKTENEANP